MGTRTVGSYFDRLDRELSDLPSARRHELLEELRNHVEDALATTSDPSESDVRNVLEQLGEPADIAEEARQRFGITRTRPTWREWTAVMLFATVPLMMQVFLLAAALAWVIMIVLVVTSRVWTARDKTIGVLALPSTEIVILLWLRAEGHAGIVPIALTLFGIPLVCAVYLGYRLRH